jgi:hypothetical protein
MRKIVLLLAFAVVAAAWSSAASAAPFRGVVVGKQRGSVLVASPGGAVRALGGHASVGAVVSMSGGHLAIVGRSHIAAVRGIVVRHIGPMMFLSSNRHLVVVRTARRLASVSATPATPQPGDLVAAQVSIESNGDLVETEQSNLGPTGSNTIQVQAAVAAVGTGTVSLTVEGQTLVVPLPSGLTLPASLVGQTVTVTLELAGPTVGAADDDDNGNNDNGNNGNGFGTGFGGGGGHDGGGDGGDGGGGGD